MLAGNVGATLIAGNLMLQGDSQSNSIEITVDGSDIVLRGQDGTMVNGSSDAFVIEAGSSEFGGDIAAELGDGDDTLLINGPLTIGGDVLLDNDRGVGQFGITAASIDGDVRMRSGRSSDTVSLLETSIGGALELRLGRGRSFVSLQSTTVQGQMSVRTGDRDDVILLQGSEVGGFWAETGRREDDLIFRDTTINGDFHAGTGHDRDYVLMEDSMVTGDTALWLWTHSDVVVTQGEVHFGGHFFAGGILGRNDRMDLSDQTTFGDKKCVIGFEQESLSDATIMGVNDRIGERLVEAAMIQQLLNGVDPGEQFLTVDTSANPDVVESGDILVTNQETFDITGMTLPFATVSVTAGDGGALDLGSVVADADGNYSITIDLFSGPTTIIVTSTDILERMATEEFELHVAAGTVVRFDTSQGTIDVELFDEDAPLTVANFLDYADRYSDSIVHRSAVNLADNPFVIQGGGFFLDGNDDLQMVTTDPPVESEFTGAHSNVRGTIAMALQSDLFGNVNPDSGTSQWFFNLGDNSSLDTDEFTVFGEVIGSGMDVVDAIAALDRININDVVPLNTTALNEVPLDDYMLESVQLTGTVSIAANSIQVDGTGTLFTTELDVNDIIVIAGQEYRVIQIDSDTQLLVDFSQPMAILDEDVFTEPIATTVPTRQQYVVVNSLTAIL